MIFINWPNHPQGVPVHIVKSVLTAAAAMALALPAYAGLTGDTVGTRYVGLNDTGVQFSVVGAGVEGNFFSNQFYDYGDMSFSIQSTGDFCGVWSCSGPIALELSSLDIGGPINSVTFSTNLAGVIESHTADSITFSWSEQPITAGMYLEAQINAVPEPETYVLMMAGLAAIAAVRRRVRN
jgi:hypothetical protein